jgi:hypothetical protein
MFSPLNSCSIKYLEEGRMTQLCGRGRGRQERGREEERGEGRGGVERGGGFLEERRNKFI